MPADATTLKTAKTSVLATMSGPANALSERTPWAVINVTATGPTLDLTDLHAAFRGDPAWTNEWFGVRKDLDDVGWETRNEEIVTANLPATFDNNIDAATAAMSAENPRCTLTAIAMDKHLTAGTIRVRATRYEGGTKTAHAEVTGEIIIVPVPWDDHSGALMWLHAKTDDPTGIAGDGMPQSGLWVLLDPRDVQYKAAAGWHGSIGRSGGQGAFARARRDGTHDILIVKSASTSLFTNVRANCAYDTRHEIDLLAFDPELATALREEAEEEAAEAMKQTWPIHRRLA